jgi:aldehyde:ferredoxin oxidoreductase
VAGVALVDVAARQVRTFSPTWGLDYGPLPTALARWAMRKGHTPFLVIGRGPIAGAPVVGGQVASVTGISPLAPVLTEAKIEGRLARGLRRLGLEAVLIYGHAAEPVTVQLSAGGPAEQSGQQHDNSHKAHARDPVSVDGEFLDARGYVESEVFDTDSLLRHGPDDVVITTGSRGMAGHPAASIVTNCGFPTSQGGLGAVCGQLGLKALVLQEGGVEPVATPLESDITTGYRDSIDSNPLAQSERDYPGFGLWPSEGAVGYASSDGFSGQPVSGLVDFDAQAFMAFAADDGEDACPGCPQSCLKSFHIDGSKPVDGGRVHQLGIAALASQSNVTDPKELVEFNTLCHDWGVEHLAAEEALRSHNSTHPEGTSTGALAERLARALEEKPLGSGLDERVKAMVIPPFDPRANQGLAVGYALNPTGPRYDVLEHDIDFDPAAVGPERSEVGADWGIPAGGLPMGTLDSRRHASIVSLWLLWSGMDALGVCEYAGPPTRQLSTDDVVALANQYFSNQATFTDIDRWGFLRLGLLRDANAQLGIVPDADWLPDRFFSGPLPEGPLAGSVIDRDQFLEAVDYAREALSWTADGVAPDSGLAKDIVRVDFHLDHELFAAAITAGSDSSSEPPVEPTRKRNK